MDRSMISYEDINGLELISSLLVLCYFVIYYKFVGVGIMKIYESRYGYSKFDSVEYKNLISKLLKTANDRSVNVEELENIEISSRGYAITNRIKYYAEVTDEVIYVSFSTDVTSIFANIDTCKIMPVKIGLRLKRGDNWG